MTEVKKCNCTSEFQDKTYGVGNRLHNVSEKGLKCTVCGSSSFDKKKK